MADQSQENHMMKKYIDPSHQQLNNDINNLEVKIVELSEQKSEIEQVIYDFNTSYTKEIGPVLKQYLDQREQDLEEKIAKTDDDTAKEQLAKKLKEAKEDSQNYERSQPQDKQLMPEIKLSQEEIQELKKLYRKACRLCHPDMVNEQKRAEATNIFHRLGEAHQRKDITKVKEILTYLENNNFAINDEPNDLDKLTKRKNMLTSEVLKLEIQINDLKADDTYKRILSIDNWNKYFTITKEQLKKEIHKYKYAI